MTPSSNMPHHHHHYPVPVELKRLPLGVEIRGISLRDHIDDHALFARIKTECYTHRLMVFREQGEIPADALLTMFARFGEICADPFTTQTNEFVNHQRAPTNAIMRISNDESEGFTGVGTKGWHIDGAYRLVPYSHLIFNAVKAPRVGDTKFAGHREMIAALPRNAREALDRITTLNTRTVLGKKTIVAHPLMYNHPVVNEPVLCVHLGYMEGAIYSSERSGVEHTLNEHELSCLKELITHTFDRQNERFVYSHRWQDGDLVIVDNLQIAHLASKESQMPSEQVGLRILHRLAVNGSERPTKKHAHTHHAASDDVMAE